MYSTCTHVELYLHLEEVLLEHITLTLIYFEGTTPKKYPTPKSENADADKVIIKYYGVCFSL